ncbi:CheR family methyltransferase [Celeribacter litoreus]|uniref:CheR family methyltransferase n=1 Tax=Celeribacter litoreus TaxID=2876714 RepID=UPI001CCCDF86|nr:protein-glutamate O-methyltransferase CheR [Celeribacter litoreus]MCA0044969.1 protein-glutamate O-methyltransferase CheR [Celeribacter litoreus]
MNQLSPIPADARIETALSQADFTRIAKIAEREAGIVLSANKMSMVKSRLTRRLRALGLDSYAAYLDLIEGSAAGPELQQFISALTTNVSHFFRESHHFDYLVETIVPALREKLASGGRVRIWSAGCSNGQEAYSIAMALQEAAPDLLSKDIKILATDIDPEVVSTARAGAYVGSLTSGLTVPTIERHFRQEIHNGEEVLTINDTLRKLVTFRQLNLHASWPMTGKFDIIFCRNVVIYFNETMQSRLYQRFASVLEPGGWLVLGHSERISEECTHLFKSSGVTTYQRAPLSPAMSHDTSSAAQKGYQ